MNTEAVLFDFDGTIIDSCPGIQKAFDKAYLKIYSVENKLSVQPHIGPPIGKILSSVNGETDPEIINSFINFFKEDYDTESYKSSVLFEGMKDVLKELYDNDVKIFIVTNKREKATKLIAKYLHIDDFFSGIYCSDSKSHYSSKAMIVNEIIENEKLQKENPVLVGDTQQDESAARENNIEFIYAAYGYEKLKGDHKTIFAPQQILNFINLKVKS